MKKYLSFLLLSTALLFVSCGGDDITPGEPNPNPDPTFNIAQMIGKKEGIVKISLLPGANHIETELAEVVVYQLEGIQNRLQLLFSKPEIIVGGASASNFYIADKQCQFSVGKYTTNNAVLEGDKIPAYMKEWFPKNNISKIVIGEVLCEDGVVYNIENATMSMTYKTEILVYDADSKEPIKGYSVTFEYQGLKNK